MPATIRLKRVSALIVAACFAASASALAQDVPHTVSVGTGYTYVQTNIIPGCNCVGLSGGYAQIQIGLGPHLAALIDFTGGHRSGITPDGYSLTQLTYTGGLRYWPLHPGGRLRPFADLGLGGAHALGSLSTANSGVGGSANAFALQAGGGLQIKLGSRWSLQPVQAEYLLTTFTNQGSNRQNDLRLGAGLLFRLSR